MTGADLATITGFAAITGAPDAAALLAFLALKHQFVRKGHQSGPAATRHVHSRHCGGGPQNIRNRFLHFEPIVSAFLGSAGKFASFFIIIII